MSNVKKNFQTKGMLRHMADGGFVRENAGGQFNGPQRAVDAMAEGRDPNEDRMKKGAEFGMPAGAPHQPAHTVTPTEVIGMAKAKFSQLRKAVGLANGGRVEGPGGPTDDQVPAMLSDGEFVLPADTVEHLGVENLHELVARTHKPHDIKRGQSGLRHMAEGGFVGALDPLEEHKARVAQVQARYAAEGAPMDALAEHKARVAQVQQGYADQANRYQQVEQNAGRPRNLPQQAEITPNELRLRNAAAAERAGLPGYPSGGAEAQTATKAEFDAARAARAGATAETAVGQKAAGLADTALQAGRVGAGRTAGVLRRGGSALRGLASSALRPVGTALRVAGTAAIPAAALYGMATDSPEQQRLASGVLGQNDDVGAKAFGTLGSYLGSALTLGSVSPQDFGNITDTARRSFSSPNGEAQFNHVPRDQQGYLTRHILDATGENAGDLAALAQQGGSRGGIQLITGDNDNRIPDSALRMSSQQAAAQRANGGITPVSARTGDPNEVLGAFQGRPITREMSNNMGGSTQSAPQEDPIQGALRQLLRQQGGGVGMVNSRAGSINSQFDALQKQITDTYGGKAQGTMISKLLDLQKARADALGQDQGALVNSQGNVVNADNSVRSQQASALGDMVSSRNTDKTVSGSLLREQLQGIREADQAQRAGVKDNRDTLFSDIQAQTPLDKDGNPVGDFRPDQVLAFLSKTNPEVANMDRADRAQLIAGTIASMKGQQGFDSTRGFLGTPDSTATPVGEFKGETNPLDAAALYGGGIEGTSILRHMLPFQTNDRVMRMSNGQLAYADDIGGDEVFQQQVAEANAARKKKDK